MGEPPFCRLCQSIRTWIFDESVTDASFNNFEGLGGTLAIKKELSPLVTEPAAVTAVTLMCRRAPVVEATEKLLMWGERVVSTASESSSAIESTML